VECAKTFFATLIDIYCSHYPLLAPPRVNDGQAQHAGVKIYCTFSLLSEITPSATFHFRPNDFPLTELGYCDLDTKDVQAQKINI